MKKTVAKPAEGATGDQTLGAYLFYLRRVRRLTLREVEAAAQRGVSNSYISQLEHDRIRKPSPNVLYSLAQVYSISYELLMEKAGYVSAMPDRDGPERDRATALANEKLTPREEEELLRYLAFLRAGG